MKRSLAFALGLFAAVVILGIAAAWLLLHINWNRAKPWLSAKATQAIGREVMIAGDLHVDWMRDPQSGPWSWLIPYAKVRASGVSVANAPWAQQPLFGSARSIEFDLSLPPLLAHTISVPAVRFVAPDVDFERRADGQDNWTFAPAGPLSWRLDLGSVLCDTARLSIADRVRNLDARIDVSTLERQIPFAELVAQQEESAQRDAAARIGAAAAAQLLERVRSRDETLQQKAAALQHYAFGFKIEGKLRGNSLKGHGELAGVFALKDPNRPFPLHADVHVGDTHIALIGTITNPTDVDALDLRLSLSGKSLAALYDSLRVTMPESPPYATDGHLHGHLGAASSDLSYEDFVARVGSSDLTGDLHYAGREPRAMLSGKVVSRHLQFRDLAPMIGARQTPEISETADRLLPRTPMRPQRWRAMDADVQFSGDHVFLDSELPIHQVNTRILMSDAVLSLQPLHFRFAYGDVEAKLRFDGRDMPIKSTFDLSATNVQLKELFANTHVADLDLGTARGAAKLTASGDSIGALLGAADGELNAELDSGTISKLLIETAGLNLPNILIAKMHGDRPVKIDCAAADFAAKSGVFEAQEFVVDTDVARFDIKGHIDLADEKLDLEVRPKNKNLRILSLRSPIHISGPLRHPEVAVDKAALLARSAGALGLGVIAAPLAAVPLTHTGIGKGGSHCAPLANEAERKARKSP